MSSILPRIYIFSEADKYLEGCRTREKLSNCIQIRADEKIRKVVTERNDTTVMTIISDELVAKEACYHASCYRMYTKSVYTTKLQSEIDPEYMGVWKFLSDLFDRPEVVTSTNISYTTNEKSKTNN